MSTSDYAHLAPQVRADLNLPDALRARSMLQERFLMHERLAPLLARADFLMRRPVQNRAAGLVISGPSGSGKTMIARALQRRSPKLIANGTQAPSVPVLMINMTMAREAKTLFNRIMTALHVPDAASYGGSDREKMALKVCRQANVRLLIVDEIQDILKTTARQQTMALDTIKFLMNELSLPILALGTSDASVAMQVDKHLNARFAYKEVPTWAVDAHLANFLATLEQTLPLREPSGLASVEMMKVLVAVSGGILDPLMKAVTYAAANAVQAGSERITMKLLEEALDNPPAWLLDDPEPVAVAA